MIFSERRSVRKKKKKLYQGQKINDFNDLKIGDYVVHETHGLGIYKGIEKVEVDKVVKDYLKIEYRDGGNLYILATGLDVIQKYASADAAKKPKLNKLGGKEWEHTKTKVRSAVSAVAKDLVELYAVRQQSEGYAFGKDTVWQREFEEMFPFEADRGSAECHRGHQGGYGKPSDHGPPDLRRCGLRKDGDCAPGSL